MTEGFQLNQSLRHNLLASTLFSIFLSHVGGHGPSTKRSKKQERYSFFFYMTMSQEKDTYIETNTHDLIASGNLKGALSNEEQELRLPMYLRLLASSQNLSSITAISTSPNVNKLNIEPTHDENWNQSYIDGIVELLERVIVRYPCSDDIDILTNHLASKASKSVSKCRSLSKRTCLFSFQNGNLNDTSTSDTLDQELILAKGVVATKTSIGLSGWDTSKLVLDSGIESRHMPSEINTVSKLNEDSDNEEYLDQLKLQHAPDRETKEGVIENDNPSLKRKRQEDQEIEQDTLFDSVQNTFIELIQLMSSSLQPLLIHTDQDHTLTKDKIHHCEEDKDKERHTNKSSNEVALSLSSDSILTETPLSSSSIVERDLSAIITSISSFVPAIRHEHLSSALCRSSIPQCAQIIRRLAANFPNTSHCLIRGCIHAYKIASISIDLEEHAKHTIMKTCIMSLRSIASLSNRERLSIVSELQVSKLVPSLMVDLLMDDSPDIVLSIIFADLVLSATRNIQKKHSLLQSSFYRQRIRRKRNICDIHHDENMPWIVDAMKTDAAFRDQVESLLFQMLQVLNQNWIPGKACTVFQVLGLYIEQLGSFVNPDFLMALFTELVGLVKSRNPEPRDTSSLPLSDPDDKSLEAAFSTCFVICYRTISIDPNITEQFCDALRNNLFVRSKKGDEFTSQVENMILSSFDDAIHRLILKVLIGRSCSMYPIVHTETAVKETVGAMKKHLTQSMGDLIDTLDISKLLRASQCGFQSEFCTAVKTLLHDANRCNYFYVQNGINELLFQAVSCLNESESPKIPAVLPLTLEMNFRYMVNCTEKDEDQCRWRQLVLQFIYALKFLEVNPKSPFVLNPIILPVKWAAEKAYTENSCPCELLLSHIYASCPYIRVQMSDSYLLSSPDSNIQCRTNVHELIQIIRSVLSGKHELSQTAEKLFLACRGIVPYNIVDTAVVKALLSSNEEFCDFITYHNIVCDPLILLKCTLKVWNHNNLRRILLAVLQRALLSNEVFAQNSNMPDTVTLEYLISRDTLIAHCFMMLLSGSIISNNEERISCQLMVSMLKDILSKRKGLVSSMVKQGLSIQVMDWIVQFVDLYDEPVFLFQMMECKTLNVTERLRIADFTLSVAIFGPQEVAIASRLAFLAVSVLVHHFFLIIGPVGVPANIAHDDEGRDITHLCQMSMFRMLKTLTSIEGDKSFLKKEISHLLSRLVSMCKSEAATAGLSGVGLHKRKLLLKKVYQSIVDVNTCFGGGIKI